MLNLIQTNNITIFIGIVTTERGLLNRHGK